MTYITTDIHQNEGHRKFIFNVQIPQNTSDDDGDNDDAAAAAAAADDDDDDDAVWGSKGPKKATRLHNACEMRHK